MSKDNSVPKLDLAPKLKRPLSLCNPLDYLRLLYWSIFFPQALRWYVNTFGGGDNIQKQSISKKLDFLIRHSVQLKLSIQGLILTVFTSFVLILIFQPLRLETLIIFTSVISFSLLLGVLLGLFESLASGIAYSIILNLAWGFLYNLGLSLKLGLLMRLFLLILFIIIIFWVLGLLEGIRAAILGKSLLDFASFIATILAVIVLFNTVFIILSILTVNSLLESVVSLLVILLLVLILGIVLVLGRMNLDNWLISLFLSLFPIQNKFFLFSRVTLLPLPKLTSRLHNWLLEDWETGLDNIKQLLQYSLQFVPVVTAINQVLNQTPSEQIIYRLTQLAENPYDWNLLRFTSVSLENKLKLEFVEVLVDFPFFFFIPKNWKQKAKNKFTVDIRSDTPSRACAAGFWYLHKKKPDKATEAFTVVRSLLYGEELLILAQTLAKFQQAQQIDDIANLKIFSFPTENLLRPSTWQTMNSLKKVVEDIKLIQHSASRNTKSLAYSRAIGELAEVIDHKNNIPEAEQELIIDIAQTWKQSLERIGKEIGNVTITQPVRNPYVFGNPVTGSLFVGREDILRQLEELWITGNQLQSVVLYGHRRMGKSSILINIASCTGAEVKVIYINLQRLGAVSQGVAEVLMAISDGIATALNISPPDDDKFLKLPQRTFERYLKQVIGTMSYRGLIIALDEFETIEELIERGQIEPSFMGFLRGLVQMNPEKIAFAFAGLHTLEEMTADYFKPFFASVITIPISFLSQGATKTIVANPIADQSNSLPQSPLNSDLSKSLLKVETSDVSPTRGDKEGLEDFQPISQARRAKINSFLTEIEVNQNSDNNEFLLDYTGEALDLIYSLTSGQPYLTQLIGFLLVRNYNDQVFEQGNTQDNTLTVEDIEAVINTKFFQQGRYYFEGVWRQAAQGATGQQAILKALAPYPQGMSEDQLLSLTGLDSETLESALATLIRHDVIEKKDHNYRIIVELFRQWVLNKY